MSGNRKAAEAVILKWVKAIDPSEKNTQMYEAMFAKMTDAQFDAWMVAIEGRKDYVSIVADNGTGSKVTTDNNIKVAKQMGVHLLQKLWLTDAVTGMRYLTPIEYLVLDLPVRRQIQTLENKISIPEDNKHIDELTDQPTGASKGSSISFPELQVLYAQNLDASILELIKFRGGDEKAMRAMDKSIIDSGGASLESLKQLGTKVRANTTLSTFLKGMHFDNNY